MQNAAVRLALQVVHPVRRLLHVSQVPAEDKNLLLVQAEHVTCKVEEFCEQAEQSVMETLHAWHAVLPELTTKLLPQVLQRASPCEPAVHEVQLVIAALQV